MASKKSFSMDDVLHLPIVWVAIRKDSHFLERDKQKGGDLSKRAVMRLQQIYGETGLVCETSDESRAVAVFAVYRVVETRSFALRKIKPN